MFELLIILSRYLFVLLMALFLFEGACYILSERGFIVSDRMSSIYKQRWLILLIHLTSFFIMAYLPEELSFDLSILVIGGCALVFFLFAIIAIRQIYSASCPLMWNGVFFLMDIGLIMLTRLDELLAQRQLIWFFVSFLVMLIIPAALILVKRTEKLKWVYGAAAFGLIILPSIMGIRIYGAVNWIKIGNLSFQPSEIVKFLFVFYLAASFRKKPELPQLVFPTVVSGVFVLILVYQRDLGGALIFFMTYMTMLYIATGNGFLFLGGMGFFAFASYVAYNLFSHVRVRVMAWQNPWQDIDSGGYQIVQGLFAIGTWGLFGSGLTRGYPGYVPVVESDFIFTAICEEFGILFALGFIGVFIMVFYRGFHISLRCPRRFDSLLAAGFTGMLAFQTFLIIGGNIKLIPLTGVTLPFVSQGGSSIMASILMVGIIQWLFMSYGEGSPNASWDEE